MLPILHLLIAGLIGAHADVCSAFKMTETAIPLPASSDAKSFLWRVEKNGTESYLIGTFHTTQVLDNWEGLSLIFPTLKNFVTETDFSPQSGREFAALSSDPHVDLRALLGADLFSLAQPLATTEGFDLATSHLKPWATFLALARPPSTDTASLDAFLQTQARAQGLQAIGLQSSSEMVASIETLAPAEQTQILKETICNYAAVQDQVERLKRLYTQDDVASFLAESDRLSSPVTGLTAKMNMALVTERNRKFLPRLLTALEQPAMIAVGAAHLFGDGGLIALLRSKGFTLIPLVRPAFMQERLTQANAEAPHTLDPLIAWLRDNSTVPQDYQEPALQVIPSTEMRAHGCDQNCAFTRQAHTLFVAQTAWRDLKNGDPTLQASVLAILIRDVQEAAAHGETSCSYWQTKNIESLLLRTRYLTARGVPAIGLPVLPINGCSGN